MKKKDPELLSSSSPPRSPKRVDKHGDLFAPVLELEQKLSKL